MWICEKCKESNEDSFDSCWKCQTHSGIGSEKSKVHQQTVKEEETEKARKVAIQELKYERIKNIVRNAIVILAVSFCILLFCIKMWLLF
tara:strand:+ start:67 stop:333 length:267 start_codon:yes stop_codon:yes gene_type:complete